MKPEKEARPVLAFLRDRDELVRKFILAEVLKPPVALRRRKKAWTSSSSSSR